MQNKFDRETQEQEDFPAGCVMYYENKTITSFRWFYKMLEEVALMCNIFVGAIFPFVARAYGKLTQSKYGESLSQKFIEVDNKPGKKKT